MKIAVDLRRVEHKQTNKEFKQRDVYSSFSSLVGYLGHCK